MSLVERRDVELAAKLESIEREFEYWEELSREGAPLEKHHTQIRRVTAALRGFTESVRDELVTPDGHRRAALLVLDLHQIWDVFRGKLALRCVPWFERPLIAADDHAWACYRPATAAGVRQGIDPDGIREPPLVSLSGDAVARAHTRGGSYAGMVAGGLFGPTLLPALRALPVPVVTVPWYQVEHVPDALAIGHEVGHLVEEDLGLAAPLRTSLERALGPEACARLPAWEAWQGEVFADVYGCLAAGPAYAGWLLDLLAGVEDSGRAADGDGGWGHYPPAGLRASLVLAVIAALGFDVDAAGLRAAPTSTGGDAGPTAFHADVERVVAAVLDGPYPSLGGKLTSVLSFRRLEDEAARDEARRLLNGEALVSGSVRVLLAAGAHAFRRDPRAFRSRRLGGRLLDRVAELRTRGTRGPGPSVSSSVLAADRQAGRRLFDELARQPRE